MALKSLIYDITPDTKAIMIKDSSYYRSLILETGRERISVYKPEYIIEHSCVTNGASLVGRRTAVEQILKTRSKLPIPVAPRKDVYMFPTASVKNKDCVWLSYYHVHYFEQRDDKTFVAFYDGTGLYVNASEAAVDMQFKKASQVIAQMKGPDFESV
ncbi:competence protein ComK [Lentibacillus sp. N15]|uniref:competence protein ComK n=1 Tax=Lentibacillus songyuanensis TaxID=3136161 RepID=UPI0031BB78AC